MTSTHDPFSEKQAQGILALLEQIAIPHTHIMVACPHLLAAQHTYHLCRLLTKEEDIHYATLDPDPRITYINGSEICFSLPPTLSFLLQEGD